MATAGAHGRAGSEESEIQFISWKSAPRSPPPPPPPPVVTGIQLTVEAGGAPADFKTKIFTGVQLIRVGRVSTQHAARLQRNQGHAAFVCPVMSRAHAHILLDGSSAYLSDLKARHGTTITRGAPPTVIRLSPMRDYELFDGDLITFGKIVSKEGMPHEPVAVRVKLLADPPPPPNLDPAPAQEPPRPRGCYGLPDSLSSASDSECDSVSDGPDEEDEDDARDGSPPTSPLPGNQLALAPPSAPPPCAFTLPPVLDAVYDGNLFGLASGIGADAPGFARAFDEPLPPPPITVCSPPPMLPRLAALLAPAPPPQVGVVASRPPPLAARRYALPARVDALAADVRAAGDAARADARDAHARMDALADELRAARDDVGALRAEVARLGVKRKRDDDDDGERERAPAPAPAPVDEHKMDVDAPAPRDSFIKRVRRQAPAFALGALGGAAALWSTAVYLEI